MSKKIYIIIIVFVLMALSFYGGSFNCTLITENGFSEVMKSPLVKSWNASVYGEITSISGRTLSITLDEETLEVPIREDSIISRVYFESPVAEGVTPAFDSETIQFEDLAVGQMVSIMAEVAEDGTLTGINVAVIEEVAAE